MRTPIVSELPLRLEPVTPDDFVDVPAGPVARNRCAPSANASARRGSTAPRRRRLGVTPARSRA